MNWKERKEEREGGRKMKTGTVIRMFGYSHKPSRRKRGVSKDFVKKVEK